MTFKQRLTMPADATAEVASQTPKAGTHTRDGAIVTLRLSIPPTGGGSPPSRTRSRTIPAFTGKSALTVAEWDDQLAEMARLLHTEPVAYVLGSGPLEGAAQTLAMCYLQEMQNLHATALSAGEFLHGPFEVITEDVAVILLKGDDVVRPMAERAERFLRQYTRKLWVLDARELSLESVDPDARPLVADLVLGSTTLNRIAEHFASWTGRPLADRHYMWKIDY